MGSKNKLFGKNIMLRGIKYYCEGNVKSLSGKNGDYTAVVRGSWDYTVRMKIEDGEVKKLGCDCPFAMKKQEKSDKVRVLYCKHMAAVVCAIYDEKNKGLNLRTDAPVRAMRAGDMKLFLKKVAQKGRKVDAVVTELFSPFVGDTRLQLLKKRLVKILALHTNNYCIIPGHHDVFCCELEEFLHSSEVLLKQYDSLPAAFELTLFACSLLNEQFLNSEGELYDPYKICASSFYRVLEQMDIEQKKSVFEVFCRLYNFPRLTLSQKSRYRSLLYVLFKEPEFLEKILSIYKNSLNKWWMSDEEEKEYIGICVDIMSRLDYSAEQLRDFWNRYWAYSSVRMMAVNFAIKHCDFSRAIAVLKESKWLDIDDKSLTKGYSEHLIALYDELGMKEELKGELIFFLSSYFLSDFSCLERLRPLCTEEEWQQYYELAKRINPHLEGRFLYLDE